MAAPLLSVEIDPDTRSTPRHFTRLNASARVSHDGRGQLRWMVGWQQRDMLQDPKPLRIPKMPRRPADAA